MSLNTLSNATWLSINVANITCENLECANGVGLQGDVNIAGELSIGTAPNSYVFPTGRPTTGQYIGAIDDSGTMGFLTGGGGGGSISSIVNTDGNIVASENAGVVTLNLSPNIDVTTMIADQIQCGVEYTLPKVSGASG